MAPPPPSDSIEPYQIGPGDQLDIVVWKEDQVSGKVQVRPDGMITVPLIGELQAAGKTPDAVAEQITTGLSSYIDDPRVAVRVEATARRFFVIGNVRAPGAYPLTADQTVLQGLAVCGGLTEFADRGGVRIIRSGGSRPGAIAVDYDAIVKGRELDIALEPNDTIVVP
jgi:polysaccharide export outer membrane protein